MVLSQVSELPKVELTPLDIALPEWKNDDFSAFNRGVEVFKALTDDVGIGSGYFFKVCQRLETAVFERKIKNINGYISTSLDVRALTYLLATSEAFAKQVTLTPAVMDKIEAVRDPISTWALDFLVKAYLKHYDYLAQGETLTLIGEFIAKHLFFYQLKRREVTFRRLYKHREFLFEPNCLQKVIHELNQPKVKNLPQLAKRWGVSDYLEGRYFQVCQFQEYLSTLAALEVGEDHPVLQQLCEEDVCTSTYSDEKLLGHQVLETLIERCIEHQDIPPAWRNIVLTIAGDPRQGEEHEQYQKWWSLLTYEHLNKMHQWMMRFDVELFVQLLFDGNEVTDPVERRKHPMVCRQAFVEGLLDCGLIRESRLLISTQGRKLLLEEFEENTLPSNGKLSGQKASVMYLNIDGKVHGLIGTGNFKMKLFDKEPDTFRLTYEKRKTFSGKNLGNALADQYYGQYGFDGGFQEYQHDTGLHWQHQSLSYLRENAVKFHPEDAMTKVKYSEFKSRFGHQLYRYKNAKRLKPETNFDDEEMFSISA